VEGGGSENVIAGNENLSRGLPEGLGHEEINYGGKGKLVRELLLGNLETWRGGLTKKPFGEGGDWGGKTFWST